MFDFKYEFKLLLTIYLHLLSEVIDCFLFQTKVMCTELVRQISPTGKIMENRQVIFLRVLIWRAHQQVDGGAYEPTVGQSALKKLTAQHRLSPFCFILSMNILNTSVLLPSVNKCSVLPYIYRCFCTTFVHFVSHSVLNFPSAIKNET